MASPQPRVSGMTTNQLRAELKQRNLKHTGSKQELLMRLNSHTFQLNDEASKLSDSDEETTTEEPLSPRTKRALRRAKEKHLGFSQTDVSSAKYAVQSASSDVSDNDSNTTSLSGENSDGESDASSSQSTSRADQQEIEHDRKSRQKTANNARSSTYRNNIGKVDSGEKLHTSETTESHLLPHIVLVITVLIAAVVVAVNLNDDVKRYFEQTVTYISRMNARCEEYLPLSVTTFLSRISTVSLRIRQFATFAIEHILIPNQT